MSMAFVCLGWMLLLAIHIAVLLSICIGVLGYLCPISCSVFLQGTASWALINIAPSSASAADDMTALMIWAVLSTAPLLAGSSSFSERKKWPPALLHALGSLRCNASLCSASIILLALYVTIVSGC